MTAYTREACEKWRRNKTVNPLTGRKITSKGPTYLEFKKSCAAHKISTVAPSSSSSSSSLNRLSTAPLPSRAMTASLTRAQCEEWRKNKAFSPLSGRRINIRGAIYNAHKKSCKQYKTRSTKKSSLLKPQKATEEAVLITSFPRYVRPGNYAKWTPLDIKKRYVFLTFKDDSSTQSDMISMIKEIDSKRKDTFDDASWDQLMNLYKIFHRELVLENVNPWNRLYARQKLIKFLRSELPYPPDDVHSLSTVPLSSVNQGPRPELVRDYRNAFALYRAQRYGHDDKHLGTKEIEITFKFHVHYTFMKV